VNIKDKKEPIKLVWEYMPPKELRGNSRAHWAVRNKFTKMFKESTIFRLMEVNPEPMDKIRVKYIAHWCGKPIDADNLIKGMKPALDALTEYGLIEDDNPEYVKGIEVEYHRVKHKHQVGMIMEITEA
jgi:Holliday junction resolvase RusA-like endonuclease